MDVLIIGAGLSGVTAAYYLAQAGVGVTILEARDRIGGRIHSVTTDDGRGAFDLGPTWYWEHQANIIALLDELGLAHFTQFETGHGMFEQQPGTPAQRFAADWQQPISLRIAGGTIALVNALAQKVTEHTGKETGHLNHIHLNHIVETISVDADGKIVVQGSANGQPSTWRTDHVICTLPPHLAATTITYLPELPEALRHAMIHTPTWMGEAMKVVLVYDEPFWRDQNLSGMAISHIGPVQQFHDAVPASGPPAALFGWVGNNSPARALPAADRRHAVVEQATRLFGPQAAQPIHYAETNWENEPFTTNASATDRIVATEHPRYGHPLLQDPQMNGQLWWATTEAARESGGYLDGAIWIGRSVADRLSS